MALLMQHRTSIKIRMVCNLSASPLSFHTFSSLAYGGYDYNSYYPSGGQGVSGSTGDNGSGQQEKNSPNDTNNYDHDNHYGKKQAIVSSPNYHTYPIM